jgi:hypothetical protein
VKTKDRIGWVLIGLAVFMLAKGGGGLPSIVPGPRVVVVLHETAETTPAQSQMFVALRSGSNEAYLKEKGHKLLILDDDAVGADDKPLALVAKLSAALPPPSVHVLNGEAIVTSKPLPDNAAGVLDILKGAGG